MKKQEALRIIGKKTIAMALCMTMAVSGLTGCGKTSTTSEVVEEKSDEEVLEKVIEEHAGVHTATDSGEMTKEETVYILSDANGNTESVIVSDWLKNPKAENGLNDITNLSNIENTSGDEIYTEDTEGNLHWAANGNDVHYRGTVDNAKLPVDVKITYYLNGTEMSPEEIAGKSGNIKIRFDYVNNEKATINVNGKNEEVYVPFAMVSGLMLSNETFTDIKVTNGRIVSEGGSNIVVGMAFPGLSESLNMTDVKEKAKDSEVTEGDLDDLEIPEYVEITATTTCFEIDQTMTVAVSDLIGALDSTTNKINLDNMKDSMVELSDASEQLSDGTVTLSDGAQELLDGAKKLREKSAELDDGATELNNGARDLDEGAGELLNGMTTLDDGVQTLQYGTQSLKDGTVKLKEGAASLNSGALQLKDGTSKLLAGYEGSLESQGALYGAMQLNDGAHQLNDAVQNTSMDIDTTSIISMVSNGIYAKLKENSQLTGALAEAAAVEYLAGQGLSNLPKAQIDGVASSPDVQGAVDQKLKLMADSIAQAVVPQILSGVMEKVGTSMAPLKAATQQLADGTQSLFEGIVKLYDGTKQVDDGLATLTQGTYDLQNGAYDLDNGACALNNGAIELKEGSTKLKDGTISLKDGTFKLFDGTNSLKDGTTQFVDGTGQLYDGTKELADGSIELMDGMLKFDEEGIDKLTGIFGDDVDDVVERFKGVISAGEDYKIFTNVADGVESSVKLIYKTEAVKVSK